MAVSEEKLYCAPCHRKIHDIHKMAYESTDSGTNKYLHACDFFIKLCLYHISMVTVGSSYKCSLEPR